MENIITNTEANLLTDTITCGNCIDIMHNMPDNCIDMCITSPPYDTLRSYNNNVDKTWNDDVWKEILRQLYKIIKPGGVVVWVVGDSTVNGSESGTSFRQALYAMECGFKLHDTMIYAKNNPTPNSGNRYQQTFEYMFVFSKGKPKTTNILKEPRSNKWNDKRCFRKEKRFNRTTDGNFDVKKDFHFDINEEVPRRNIWWYSVGLNGSTKDREAFKHPAIFPEKLAKDHILSWTNEGDVVFDPMCGSGTSIVMANELGRKYIGIDINEEYCNIARQRLEKHELNKNML